MDSIPKKGWNSFTANTTINLYLPNSVIKAVLYIYFMQVEQIHNLIINEFGNTSYTSTPLLPTVKRWIQKR